MTEIDAQHGETLHVFAHDGTLAEAEALVRDAEALGRALGGAAVQAGRAEAIAPAGLADLGLSAYLAEGLGAAMGPVRADRARLDAERRPVVILLPRAVTGTLAPRPPLAHLGSYALEHAAPARGDLHSDAASGTVSTAPPARDRAGANRRASGMVAMVALAAALLVVVVVWLVAAA